MAKRRAKITLKGPLSYSVGRYRFVKDRPVLSDDEELIRYCESNPDFQTTTFDPEEAPKKAASRSVNRQAANAPKVEKKSEAKAEKTEKKKSKPAPVSDEIAEEDVILDSSEEEDSASDKKVSSSRLTRKKKKGDDA